MSVTATALRRRFVPVGTRMSPCSYQGIIVPSRSLASGAELASLAWKHFDKEMAAAYTPPNTWYTNKSFFSHVENQITFSSGWLVVGRREQLIKEGDYLAGNIAGTHPWVIVQGADGKLNGFYNVCRHHAAQIVDEGEGSLHSSSPRESSTPPRFVCPYHGWQYTLEGKLTKATQLKGCLNFKPRENGLRPILVDHIGPWIFARLNTENSTGSLLGDQPDMKEFFEMLQATRYSELVHVRSKSYELKCNYKVSIFY